MFCGWDRRLFCDGHLVAECAAWDIIPSSILAQVCRRGKSLTYSLCCACSANEHIPQDALAHAASTVVCPYRSPRLCLGDMTLPLPVACVLSLASPARSGASCLLLGLCPLPSPAPTGVKVAGRVIIVRGLAVCVAMKGCRTSLGRARSGRRGSGADGFEEAQHALGEERGLTHTAKRQQKLGAGRRSGGKRSLSSMPSSSGAVERGYRLAVRSHGVARCALLCLPLSLPATWHV